MSDKPAEIFLSDVLLEHPVEWPKAAKKVKKKNVQVVYEDDLVIGFLETDDESAPTHPGELHATVIPKKYVPSLIDLTVADGDLTTALLNGIQKTAFALGLHKKGFEVRANVLPPYQHAPGLKFKIRSGKPKKSHSEVAAEAAAASAATAAASNGSPPAAPAPAAAPSVMNPGQGGDPPANP